MKLIKYPVKENWKEILQRPSIDSTSLQDKVKLVLNDVKQNGDAAVKKYTQQFDGVDLNDFVVTENEIIEAAASLSDELKTAIQTAAFAPALNTGHGFNDFRC